MSEKEQKKTSNLQYEVVNMRSTHKKAILKCEERIAQRELKILEKQTIKLPKTNLLDFDFKFDTDLSLDIDLTEMDEQMKSIESKLENLKTITIQNNKSRNKAFEKVIDDDSNNI